MKSCSLECATVFWIKNTVFVQHLINRSLWYFYFDLVPPFYFLKLNHFLSTFVPTLGALMNVGAVWVPKLKSILSSKILKSTHLVNINSLWNCLSRNSLLIRLIIITWFYYCQKHLQNTLKTAWRYFSTQLPGIDKPKWHESKLQTFRKMTWRKIEKLKKKY